jgi:hypothetical protein
MRHILFPSSRFLKMSGTGECGGRWGDINDSQSLACSPYSRQQAAYPVPWLRERKVWPAVSRVDDGELAITVKIGCHAYGSND